MKQENKRFYFSQKFKLKMKKKIKGFKKWGVGITCRENGKKKTNNC